MADETVKYDILLEATKALLALKNLTTGAETATQKIKMLTAASKDFMTKTGASSKSVVSAFRDVDESLTGMLSRGQWGDVQKNLDGVGSGVAKTGKAAKSAAGDFHILGNRVNIVRTAFGTLLAVGIFQFLNAISGALRTVIENLRETELAVYNLINAERKLSEQGIEITPQGLQETIDGVQELVPILSQIQAEELVSRIASNVAPSIKLTREEIEKLSKAVALAYVQNKALGYSFDEVEKSFTESVLTGKVSQGINKYGVKIDDLIVKQHAVSMNLVESEKAFDDLSAEMQAHIQAVALIDYAYQEFSKNAGTIDEYMQTTDAQMENVSKQWSDLATTAATAFGPAIAKGLEVVAQALRLIIALLEAGKPLIQFWTANLVALADATRNLPQYFKLGGGMDFIKNFKDSWGETMETFEGLEGAVDTPTAALDDLGDAFDNTLKDAEDFENKIEDILQDAQNARDDLETKLGQKRADIDQEYQRKALDAQVDYGRKVEDINRDYERDIAKIKSKQREEDLRAEENYQLKLWELRMRFLMNLEDALHARDARQVIRLQKEYEIDKEALARKQGLDDKQRDADQAAELEDAAIKRDQRLADAKVEYEQKLADQRLAKQRELDDLAVWYAREQKDIETNVQRKLEALINGWIQEKKITEENAAAVYAILAKYFGPGGMTDALYAYMAQKLATPLPMPMFGGGTGPQPYWQLLENQQNAAAGGGGRRNTNRSGRGMAEGGTLIATRPTTVTFGEAGAEMASFTPLGRLGKNVGTVFSDGGGGLMGQITLAVDLSPDLEARMTKNTMNNVADIVLKVNRSKL